MFYSILKIVEIEVIDIERRIIKIQPVDSRNLVTSSNFFVPSRFYNVFSQLKWKDLFLDLYGCRHLYQKIEGKKVNGQYKIIFEAGVRNPEIFTLRR